MTSFSVSDLVWVIALVIVVGVIVALYISWINGVIFRRKRPFTGPESLIGKMGIAKTDLRTNQDGEVSVEGISWRARVSPQQGSDLITKGETVVIVQVSSLTLIVKGI